MYTHDLCTLEKPKKRLSTHVEMEYKYRPPNDVCPPSISDLLSKLLLVSMLVLRLKTPVLASSGSRFKNGTQPIYPSKRSTI
jgi:hypothetical protein